MITRDFDSHTDRENFYGLAFPGGVLGFQRLEFSRIRIIAE